MLKRNTFIILMLLICTFSGFAQRHFNPELFKIQLHKYILEKVQLSNQEKIAFFPIYDQMLNKRRGIFMQLRAIYHTKPVSEQQAKALYC